MKSSDEELANLPDPRGQPPDFEREPPQKWLERIEELRRLGQTAQAEEMLAEFKRRFPDHSLPPTLR